jgi:hypothetical protein
MDKKIFAHSLLCLAPPALVGLAALVAVGGAEGLADAGKLPNMANALSGIQTLLAWVLAAGLGLGLGVACWLGRVAARRAALLAAPLRRAAEAGLASGAAEQGFTPLKMRSQN